MNWIKKNIVVIIFILTLVSDSLFKITETLDLSTSTGNYIKIVGAIVAVLLTQAQAIIVEKTKTK